MHSEDKDLIYGVFVTVVVFSILIVLIILLVYNYFKVRSQREKDILKAIFQTQESERARISEDLHDDIGMKLSALKLQNEMLIDETLQPTLKDQVHKNAKLIDLIVSDIRRAIRNQSPKFIINNGLFQELTFLCNLYKELAKVEYKLELNRLPFALKEDFNISLYRIFQELLHNSIKHSQATVITIIISSSNSQLIIFYSDNGIGYDSNNSNILGIGLKNIQARARIYNGNIVNYSMAGVETSFSFSFPIASIIDLNHAEK